MTNGLEIREGTPDDVSAIKALYPEAFPDEDLLPLVSELLQAAPIAISLVGVMDSSLVGHIMFTRCSVAESEDRFALLGPLAVAPARQRQGIGSTLVRAGLRMQEDAGVSQVYVLGDPAYYGRLGFGPEFGVMPPYPLPAEWRGAWQAISLAAAKPPLRGKLAVPQPWRQPALWTD